MLAFLFKLLSWRADARAVGKGPGGVARRVLRKRGHRAVRRMF